MDILLMVGIDYIDIQECNGFETTKDESGTSLWDGKEKQEWRS